MKFICDFHIHSHYSIATSKNLIPEHLEYWARLKGITVVGTGDFTHPGWIKELKEKLEPAEPGLFKLKEEYKMDNALQTPFKSEKKIRFLLTAEISNIYKKSGKVRKVHNVIFAPDFETVERFQSQLTGIGANITSDGRPILGLDSRNLLEMALNSSENVFFVPAHIWTPWFSALGDKSGFDTIDECYDDLSDHIFAIETGLSSDPPMNWICSFLDKYTIISNSDAHSPEKLGRECNLFDTELSYNAIVDALKTGDSRHFLGTIEFFPQEGKYHYDGHRKCNVVWDPVKTIKNNGICPVCGKKITIGVMNRVLQLSDREDLTLRKNRSPFYSLIPLKEILSEITGTGPNSKKVTYSYHSLIQKAGPELEILLNLPIDEIKDSGGEELSEAIRRMRNREVFIKEGYDGEYGQIKVFEENEIKGFKSQGLLFGELSRGNRSRRESRKMLNFDLSEYRKILDKEKSVSETTEMNVLKELNPAQQQAADHLTGPAIIIAGPGTGKTRVLTHRIANLIQNKNVPPESILAVTFTNKATEEMKERLAKLLNNTITHSKPEISTFHALGYSLLKKHCDRFGRNQYFSILDDEDKNRILRQNNLCERGQVKDISRALSEIKQKSKPITDQTLSEIFKQYEKTLNDLNAFDLNDLIALPVKLLNDFPEICSSYKNKYQWILVDEYQDINLSQYQLIRTLMREPESNLCVIGDPNQAIYGFRGADVTFIKQFINDYPNASVYRLEKSYRCTHFILNASKGVIQNGDLEKNPLKGIQKGIKINISKNISDRSEAEFVARTIEEMIGGLRFFSMDSEITTGQKNKEIESLSDFAVLCRLTSQMEVMEKAFRNHNIPYQTIGDNPFFKQEPIKSVIDVLKLLINPKNTILKDTLMEKKIINQHPMPEWMSRPKPHATIKETLSTIINQFFNKKKGENEQSFNKLLDMADSFSHDHEGFLKFITLGKAVDVYRPDMENVTLMTIHASKGLEFKCVFIIGCEKGILPYSLFEERVSDIDEEKRLLYVGMTRAKKFLYLLHAEKRFIFGKEYRLERSPFLSSIEKELIEHTTSKIKKKEKNGETQLKLFDFKKK